MAYEIDVFDLGTTSASADLSAKQFYLVDVSGDNTVIVASSAGQAVLGVLQNAPESGQAANVRVYGVSKVVVGTGDITAGDLVQTDASGTAIAAASGDYSIGICLVGASAGENATILVTGPSAGQIN